MTSGTFWPVKIYDLALISRLIQEVLTMKDSRGSIIQEITGLLLLSEATFFMPSLTKLHRGMTRWLYANFSDGTIVSHFLGNTMTSNTRSWRFAALTRLLVNQEGSLDKLGDYHDCRYEQTGRGSCRPKADVRVFNVHHGGKRGEREKVERERRHQADISDAIYHDVRLVLPLTESIFAWINASSCGRGQISCRTESSWQNIIYNVSLSICASHLSCMC